MSSIKEILRDGVIIGITLSNNRAIGNNKRRKILHSFIIKMNEIQESPSENGDGD
jgi:hypothetical protein